MLKDLQRNEFVGENLRIIRLFHGMSQPDVAQKLSVTRQYLNKIEGAKDYPSEEFSLALADVFGVDVSYFYRVAGEEPRMDQVHFRKQRTAPQKFAHQAIAAITLFKKIVSFLDERYDFPASNFPEIVPESSADIEKAAEVCREYWGISKNAPIANLTDAVEANGSLVAHFQGVSEKVDALSTNEERPLIVRSSAKSSLYRLRFDIAHEIGHRVLHLGVDTGDKRTEAEANRFASALLLPRHAFVNEFPRGNRIDWEIVFSLKMRWGVSAKAIIRRAFDLGIVDAVQYRRAHIHFSKTGQSKSERYDEIGELEESKLLSDALADLAEDEFELQKFYDFTGLNSDTIAKLTGVKMPSVDHSAFSNVYFLR